MPDGLSGKEQTIYFSKVRKSFESYACSKVMGRRKKMSEHLTDTNVGNIEYISKADAVDALAKTMPTLATPDGAGEFDHEIHIADEAFADAIRIIESIKPADVVQVVHARWENYSPITIKCSRCGHVIHDWRYSECKYCPNCGAKMDGGDEYG